MWELVLTVLDQGESNILDQVELINFGVFTRDSGFNVLGQTSLSNRKWIWLFTWIID